MESTIAGIDDATKCPCIGSIFVAGVAADKTTVAAWQQAGVTDSKILTRKKRNDLAIMIKEQAQAYTIQQITPSLIDDKATFNLNDREMLCFLKILSRLSNAIEIDQVFVDNWEVSAELFFQRLNSLIAPAMKKKLVDNKIRINRKKIETLTIVAEHYADENHTIVGAASILAKVASDQQYAELKKMYGDFGSGSPADPKTRLFVWNNRHNPPNIIRTSWKTYKTISALSSILDDSIYFNSLKRKHQQQSTKL